MVDFCLQTPRTDSDSLAFVNFMQGAYVYVSGSANKMPLDVMAAFEDAIVSAGLERQAAKQYLRDMELRGRYCVEAWS